MEIVRNERPGIDSQAFYFIWFEFVSTPSRRLIHLFPNFPFLFIESVHPDKKRIPSSIRWAVLSRDVDNPPAGGLSEPDSDWFSKELNEIGKIFASAY